MSQKLLFAGLAGLALVACNPGKDETGDTNGTTDCGITAENTVPGAGATDAYYRGAVEFELSDPDPEMDPTISLSGPSGDVPGTVSYNEDKDVVYFTPTNALESQTTYTATLHYCSGDSSVDFTTSELGGDLTADLLGKTYVLDIASARFVEPAAVGGLIGTYATMDILVGITGVSAAEITMMGALSVEDSDPPTQDFCTPTFDFPAADFNQSPFFQVGPADTPLTVAGYTVTVRDLEISGTFAPDGSYFGGGVLGGLIDARDLVGVVPDMDDPAEICALTASFGAPCIACGDGEEFCLRLLADQIVAEEHPTGATLEVVELENCHDQCADTSGCTE